jgi:hypothetical protein
MFDTYIGLTLCTNPYIIKGIASTVKKNQVMGDTPSVFLKTQTLYACGNDIKGIIAEKIKTMLSKNLILGFG